METDKNLRPLWDAILEIYKAIAGICERHGLRFYVTGGNCLGAVRHKGFIPWDDDMDIFLPWDDYDKFWQYAEEELPAYWKAVGWWNTPEIGEVFGKIMESRQDVIDRVGKQSGLRLEQGIFVDVFPLVNRPYTLTEKFKWAFSGFFLKLKTSFVGCRGKRLTIRSKVAGLVGWLFWWIYPSIKNKQSAMLIHERRARRFKKRSDGYCGWYRTNLCDVIAPIPSIFFDNVTYLPYDSIEVPVPGNYEGYLKYKFGDYMKLPPESQRVPVHMDVENVPWRLGPTGQGTRLCIIEYEPTSNIKDY